MQDPGFIVPGIHLPPSWVNKASRRAEADLNYRTARCSKRISWAPSLRTAWNASSGSFVFRESHAVPVPANFMTPHIYPSLLPTAVAKSNAGDRLG
jgi:hypothetical protein